MKLSVRRIWATGCMSLLALFIAARLLHYAGPGLPRALDDFVGDVLKFRLLLSWNSFLVAPGFWLPALLLIAPVLVLRFKWCVRREGGRWALRAWLEAFLWAGFACNSLFLDVTPEAAALWLLAVPVLAYRARMSPDERRSRKLPIAFGVAFGLWLLTAPPLALVAYGAVWVLAAWAVARLPFYRFRDLLVNQLILALLLQVALVFDVAGLSPAGGAPLGEGGVYGFCESPDGKRLFAAVSNCGDTKVEQCREGHIAEYALDDLSDSRRHAPFDEAFYGRLLVLICLDDSVIAAMGATVIDGELRRLNTLELGLGDPPWLTRRLPVGEGGGRLLYDPRRDALYSLDEFSNQVVRIDRRSGARTEFLVGPEGRELWTGFMKLPGSLSSEAEARSDRRNSLFFGEWLVGSTVYELDRDTLTAIAEYRPNNGGNFSIAVDEELGRLILAGLWGIDVIDLESGAVIHRRATSAGPRVPLIDERRDLVYVTSPFGNIRVFDRHSFEPLGQIGVGGWGARHGHLSGDGRYLFLSNQSRHFAWDAGRLAERFGREAGPGAPAHRPAGATMRP